MRAPPMGEGPPPRKQVRLIYELLLLLLPSVRAASVNIMAVNKCIKTLLILFNVLFWICGCVILGVGIYLKVTKDGNQLTNSALPGVDLMIAIGVIVFVLAFLGCLGAYKESRCMLMMFFIFLLVIFILLVAAGILGAVGEKTVNDWVRKELQKLTPLSNQPDSVKKDLEALQAELKCCGIIQGPADWTKPPASCFCNGTDTTCKGGIYQTPCADQIINLMKENMKVVLGISFAIAIIMILGMIFSMMIYCQIGRKEGPTQ
uniref:Tetraspanin n=1 Tax=Oryzias latipes TaxID=8090 RepID=A0A3P9H8A6_ORYLA